MKVIAIGYWFKDYAILAFGAMLIKLGRKYDLWSFKNKGEMLNVFQFWGQPR